MAISPYIGTLEALKTYIKRRLGSPVVRVELTDAQLLDCIDLALDKFIEIADDGTQMRFKTVSVTAGVQE